MWAPPTTAPVLAAATVAPWGAPNAATRVSMPAPTEFVRVMLMPPRPGTVPISTVEPMHAVALPDLVALARQQSARTMPARRRRSSIPSKPVPASRSVLAPIDPTPVRLPRPELTDLVQADADVEAAAVGDRSGVTGWVLGAVAVGAAACVALAAAVASWL